MLELKNAINAAVASGKLLPACAKNIEQLLASGSPPIYEQSIGELVEAGNWQELNDRFFRTLAFGTGGLRGRTIGRVVTNAERGSAAPDARPEHPCVGTNAMNFFNVSRATQGLAAYIKDCYASLPSAGRPSIAIAHDTRHFSREFAELVARVAVENGCDAFLFAAPRSTPELSFAVRLKCCAAGIVITASHNPPHDNGFKVYFSDGAQVIEPHASGIIGKVNAIQSEVYELRPAAERGQLRPMGAEIDEAYMERLGTLVLDPAMVKSERGLRIVFTSIHGTGGEIVKPMLDRLGFSYDTVAEQEIPDGDFPTVKSPNPENAEALSMAVALAEKNNADLVIATDPDCDRMGVAARDSAGKMKLFSGNQIGSLMAFYRVKTLIDRGVITPENAGRGVIIKTFVTTDLQKSIAQKYGLRCVETLTGFKYIGAKLTKYETALPEADRQNYRDRSEAETRALRLEKSSFYVFGGEESYGYSGADFTRDKDGNGATVMFAEVAAYAKSRGLTLDDLLDEIYSEFGFYFEKNGSLTFEGADGAAKIKKLADSYASDPPAEVDGVAVSGTKNFATETFHDVEGDQIPSEKMLMFELADGRRVAVRPSGTEPKIKFYMFAHRDPPAGKKFAAAELASVKANVSEALEKLWSWLQADAERRLAD
ncbi:MAG: phospho-sugar mutase [Verrucomicrobiota bacterium]|nr:phospho-sugar mutase [Verrucomicrobiota bacterium]